MDLAGFAGLGAVVGVSDRGRREVVATGVAVGTPLRIASLTKTVTAAATAKALLDKGFGLDTAVAGVLTELSASLEPSRVSELGLGLTVGQVLSQSSGLRQTASVADVAALGEGDDVFARAARLVVAGGQEDPPGERWAYYNGNYFVAGALLARLTGGTFENGLGELIAAAGYEVHRV